MKLLQYAPATVAVLSLFACTVPPSPTAPTATVKADALGAAAGFEPDFYRAFLQNGYEAPSRLESIRVLKGPLRLYLQTHDDAGRGIDGVTLDTTERALVETTRIWSGDTFGVTEIVRGVGTREKVSGWITVKWASAPAGDRCGRSTVGVDGGYIEFNASGACSCGTASLVYPRLVRHELGHVMGYYHTDSIDDVMYGQGVPADACDIVPSERERVHARFAHTPSS